MSEGASHLVDKTEARLNDASARRGTTSKPSDAMGNAGERASSEVDDLLRSSKNGRM
jgi:hypothetical protein